MNLRTRSIAAVAIPFLALAGCFVVLVVASAVAPGTVLADSAWEEYIEPPAPPAPPARGDKKTPTSPRRANHVPGDEAIGSNTTATGGSTDGKAAGPKSPPDTRSSGSRGERKSRGADARRNGSGNKAEESDRTEAAALIGSGGSGGGGGTLLLLLAAAVPLLAGAGYFVCSRSDGEDDVRSRLRGLHGR